MFTRPVKLGVSRHSGLICQRKLKVSILGVACVYCANALYPCSLPETSTSENELSPFHWLRHKLTTEYECLILFEEFVLRYDDVFVRACLENNYSLLADISEKDAERSFERAQQSMPFGEPPCDQDDATEISDEELDAWLFHLVDVEQKMKLDWPCMGGPLDLNTLSSLENPATLFEPFDALRPLGAFFDRMLFKEIRGKVLKVTLISYQKKHRGMTRKHLSAVHHAYNKIVKERTKHPLARGFCRFEIIVVSQHSTAGQEANWIDQNGNYGHYFSGVAANGAIVNVRDGVIEHSTLANHRKRYYQYLLDTRNDSLSNIEKRLNNYPLNAREIYWGVLTSTLLTAISLFLLVLLVPVGIASLFVLFSILPGAYVATNLSILSCRCLDQAKIFYCIHSLGAVESLHW